MKKLFLLTVITLIIFSCASKKQVKKEPQAKETKTGDTQEEQKTDGLDEIIIEQESTETTQEPIVQLPDQGIDTEPVETDRDKILLLAREIKKLEESGDFDKALDKLQQGEKSYPAELFFTERQGWVHIKKQEWDNALNAFEKANNINPDNALIKSGKGYVFHMQKQYDEALNEYEIAIQLKPDFSWAWNEIGLIKKKQGRINEAISAFSSSLTMNSKGNYAYTAYGNRAILFYQNKEYDKVIQDMENALKIRPLNSISWIYLAKSYALKGDWQTCLAKFEEAVSKYPDNFKILNSYAWNILSCPQEDLKDLDKALKYAQKAVELTKERDADVMDTLAHVYYERKNYDQAAQIVEKVLDNLEILKNAEDIDYFIDLLNKFRTTE